MTDRFRLDPTWILVAIGIGWRVRQYLADRSLWLDEVLLGLNFQAHGVGHLLTESLDGGQSAPPGFLLVVDLTGAIFGNHGLALRAVPFIVSLSAVWAARVLALRVFSTTAGRVAFVGLISLSPTLVYYSSELKQYGPDVAIALWLLVLGERLTVAPKGRALVATALVGMITPFFSTGATIVLGAIGVVWALRWWRQSGGRRATLVVGSTWSLGVGVALVYASHLTRANADLFQRFWADSFAPRPWIQPTWYLDQAAQLVHGAIGYFEPLPAAAPAFGDQPLYLALAAMALAGLLMAVAQPTRSVAGPAVTVAVGAALAGSLLEFYPFGSRPSLYLVVAPLFGLAFVVDALARVEGRAPKVLAAAGAMGLVLAAFVPFAHRLVTPYDEFDVDAAFAHAERVDRGAAWATTVWMDSQTRFYSDSFTVLTPPPVTLGPANLDVEAFLAPIAEAQPGRTWIFIGHRFDQHVAFIDQIAEYAPLLDRHEARSAGAYLFDFDTAFATSFDAARP